MAMYVQTLLSRGQLWEMGNVLTAMWGRDNWIWLSNVGTTYQHLVQREKMYLGSPRQQDYVT